MTSPGRPKPDCPCSCSRLTANPKRTTILLMGCVLPRRRKWWRAGVFSWRRLAPNRAGFPGAHRCPHAAIQPTDAPEFTKELSRRTRNLFCLTTPFHQLLTRLARRLAKFLNRYNQAMSRGMGDGAWVDLAYVYPLHAQQEPGLALSEA